MSRRLRISDPPTSTDAAVNAWMREVTDALNVLPNFSISSTTNGPESQITGDSGEWLIDVGSSATTFWAKRSGNTTTGWAAVDFV